MRPLVPSAVVLRFDGIVHTSDLPIQAFARHLTQALPAERHAALIGGMRGFLEAKPGLIPPDVDLTGAEDGEQAVEILARTAGLDQRTIDAARAAGRRDLAASVWAVEAADGLDELLAAARGMPVVVVAPPTDPAAAALLDSEDIAVDELLRAPLPDAVHELRSRLGGGHGRRGEMIVVGTRWIGELADVHEAGCITVLVDRRGSGHGTPDVRCSTLRQAATAIEQFTAETED